MGKLAVFFPGIGYNTDKPLLYYSRKIAAKCGYEVKLLPYGGFPQKIRGDREKMKECYELALLQSREMLSTVSFEMYSEVLLTGKSIGTVVAAAIGAEISSGVKVRQLLYTPLEETFMFPIGEAIAFTGSADPWTGKGKSRIPELCSQNGIPCCVIPDANHSLETEDPLEDLKNLRKIMKQSLAFIS
ncbi:MAG: alpha/beta hydrolase [Oscillospiraceae bacterium]|nr:alpha/beta hydrolase [Oscillospiraceae bacterium]